MNKDNMSRKFNILLMRVKYRLDDYDSGKNIGKNFLKYFPNSEFETDVLITLGDIFFAEGFYQSAYRTYIRSYRENTESQYENNIVNRIFMSLQYGVGHQTIDELLTFEEVKDVLQILNLSKAQLFLFNNKKI